MYGALHPKSVIDRLYLKRKHGGRGLISIEMSVRLEENNFSLYGLNEMLLKGLRKVAIVKTENLMEKEDFKKNSPNEFKNKWHEKRMYGQFFFLSGSSLQTLTIHKTAGEDRGTSFIPLYHCHPLTNTETFICNCACEILSDVFNYNACVYQTITR